jgi:hypothetical protein
MTGSGRPCMREKFLTTEITISTYRKISALMY